MVLEMEKKLENTSQIDQRYTPPFLRTPTQAEICDALLFTSSYSSTSTILSECDFEPQQLYSKAPSIPEALQSPSKPSLQSESEFEITIAE